MKVYIYTIATCLMTAIITTNASFAQIGKKIERKVKSRVDRKIDRAIDKGLDQIENDLSGHKAPPTQQAAPLSSPHASTAASYKFEGQVTNAKTSYDTKYDFIPGEKVLFYDDFSQDNIGDFPVKWNTNLSGEVVTLRNNAARWLRVPSNTIVFPEMKGKLPPDFTIEFDMIYPGEGYRPPVTFGFSAVQNPAKQSIQHKDIFYFMIPASIKQVMGYSTSLYSGRETNVDWSVNTNTNKIVKAEIAVNDTRIRLYINGEKMFDLPKAFDKSTYRNNFHFRAAALLPEPKDGFYISNIRIAESGKDVRALLQAGKYETSGIYFQTGSAKILDKSHAVLKSIADAMKENGTMKLSITGHTDNVGNNAANQKLSEQRAAAVKQYLNKHFGIDNNRMTTVGKGASEPIADNATMEGKAQNRRVTFYKI